MSGLLDFLFNDPSGSVGGTGLMGLLGLNAGNPGAATSTPLTPPASSFFTPRTGLLGSSNFANGMRGALAGLGGAGMGYGGIGELGTGASAAVDASRQRQAFQMENVLGGQQFQQGQLGAANGYGSLAMTALRLSRILGKPVSVQDLLQHPELMAKSLQDSQAGGQDAPPAGAPAPQAGMQPIYGGGTGGDPQVAQAYGPALNAAPPAPASSAPQPEPSAGGGTDQTIAGIDQAISDDYLWNDGKGVAALEAKKAEYVGAPAQAGRIAQAQEDVKFGSPQNTFSNVQTLADSFQKQDQVKTWNDVKPTYDSVLSAYNAYQPGAPTESQVPNDMNFAASVLKMINPQAANVRPNSVEAIEEAKGYQALWRRVVQQFGGGTGLTPEMRNSLKQVADQHMAAYKAAYDTTLAGYQKRAKMLGKGVTDDMWMGGSAPGSVATSGTGPTATNAQGQKIQWDGTKWAPLQ